MGSFAFHDGNITNLIDSRTIDFHHDVKRNLQMHSSLVQRLSLERELEGHQGCVNTIAWNSKGSLLISGSDDTQINIWSYNERKLLKSIDSGHSANIFCTKFIPETSDELVASGAGDAEVRVFNISRLSGRRVEETATSPLAHFQCHTRRVKKLAVEVGNPNVVWSASEDGTLRQHDLRQGCSCPPAGSSNQECRNVLLDLRSAAKTSLNVPPTQPLHLKSCDISVTRPHLLLVGGSDAFARLYDRRMLPPLSSCRSKNSPPPCVNYFCPMHLSECGRSRLHLTHVTFSPNGEEVLISYGGEHVYLMDLNQGSGNAVQYTSGDVAKRWIYSPIPNGVELSPLGAAVSEQVPATKSCAAAELEKCRKFLQIAENCLDEGADYVYGIEACNEVLDGGYKIDPMLRHDCLCLRAILLLKRKWKNDACMAARDLYQARKIDSSSFKALFYMSEALSQLDKYKEALNFALAAKCLAPSSTVAEMVENFRKQLSAAEAENNNKSNGGGFRAQPQAGRVISLSDILYRSEGNSDASQDGPRSDGEGSDYDDELELDFETSISGDEGRDVDPNVLHGSLNVRIHSRADSAREAGASNGSCGSPSSSNQKGKTSYQPEAVIDMKQRYVGHCNVGTDIKQANFLGQNGDYIASGSDDGRWFIWEKKTGRLIKMLLGDVAVVNCIQCHPFDSAVATSGINNTIKIWTPTASAPSMVAGGTAGPDAVNVLDAMESNQERLSQTREAVLPIEILERFRMHDFTEGTMHPFECAQS